jgi:hypothetical protein
MEMIRLPKEQGIYYIDNDSYVELPLMKLPFTKKEDYEPFVGKITIKKYYFPKDTLGLLIDADTTKTLRFFDYKAESTYLTKSNDDRYMLKHTERMSFARVSYSSQGLFVDTEHERVATGIRIIDFNPTDINRSYSFVEISEDDYDYEFMSGYGYCFTLKPDTLQ